MEKAKDAWSNMVIYLMISKEKHRLNNRVRMLPSLIREYGKGVLVCSGNDDVDPDCITIKPYPNPAGILRVIGLNNLKRDLEKYLFFPSTKILYVLKANKKLERSISKDFQTCNKVLLISCVPRHDICLTGLYLKQRFPALKWIIDWQDLWSYDESYFNRIPAVHKQRLLKLEQKILKTADVNITTNEPARRVMIEKYGAEPNRVVAINHYYLEEDFDFKGQTVQRKEGRSRSSVIRLGFLGTMFKPPKVPGQRLIEAVYHARKKGIDVELHVYGDSSPAARELMESNDNEWLIFHSATSHEESLRAVEQCDYLVLLLEDLPNSRIIVHQKLPHYLRMRKPILAIVPQESAVAQIIRETGSGYVIPSEDDWNLYLEKILLDYQDGRDDLERQEDRIEGFSWGSTSRKWKSLIQGIWGQG